MRNCYYHIDKETKERIFIPYCWGAVLGGEECCDCHSSYYPKKKSKKATVNEIKEEIAFLENRIKELNQLIKET